jgi:hypothetical protein
MEHRDTNLWQYLRNQGFLIKQQELHAVYQVLREMGLASTVDMALTATECRQILEQTKRYLALWEFS